jgi:ethanolamine ammonia-lyase large subunit
MLGYQSTSFHDALYVREAFGLKRAPEFEAWLARMAITDDAGRILPPAPGHRLIAGIQVAADEREAAS